MILNEAEGVQYELLDINELHELAMMTAKVFTRHEPITSSLDISSAEFTDFVRLLGPKLEQEKLTVIARCKNTKQIIGTMVTDDFAIEPPEELRQLKGNYAPLWAVLDELDTQYKQGKFVSKGEYLHLFLLAVDTRQSGKKIAQNLVKTSLEHGIRNGFKTGIVEASGLISQNIFRKFGFVDRFEASYNTFTFQGKQVFNAIKDHHGIILMDKSLS